MPEPLYFIIALAAAVGLWAAYGKLLARPRSWRARRYRTTCQICEERDAILHEKGMVVCEDCSDLV